MWFVIYFKIIRIKFEVIDVELEDNINMDDSFSYIMRSFSETHDILKFIGKSEIRVKLMVVLSSKPLSMREINSKSLLSYSSISNNLNKLIGKDLVVKRNNLFFLTNLGYICIYTILDLRKSIRMIEDYLDFWNNHDVKPLFVSSLQDLSVLEDSELIIGSSVDIYKTHKEFKGIISNSTSLKVIFPYLHPDYPSLIKDLIDKEIMVEVIISEDILPRFIDMIGYSIAKDSFKKGILSIKCLKQEVKLALAISPDSVAIGLFKNDGSFDQNMLLVSNEENAIIWANSLFDFYSSKGFEYFFNELKY